MSHKLIIANIKDLHYLKEIYQKWFHLWFLVFNIFLQLLGHPNYSIIGALYCLVGHCPPSVKLPKNMSVDGISLFCIYIVLRQKYLWRFRFRYHVGLMVCIYLLMRTHLHRLGSWAPLECSIVSYLPTTKHESGIISFSGHLPYYGNIYAQASWI